MIAQLKYDMESNRMTFDGDGLFCGMGLEVLVADAKGKPRWVQTRLEYGAQGWYCVDLPGVQANGLWARL